MNGNLTVVGSISASQYLGLPSSFGGNDVEVSTKVRASSANWDSSYTTVQSNSATWGAGGDDVFVSTKVRASSANWDSSYTAVQSNSATWNYQGANHVPLSGGTISGNITVRGSLSASQYLGLPTSSGGLSGNYLSLSGGTINGNVTIIGSISASNYLGLSSSNPVKTTLTGNDVLSSFVISGADNLTNSSAVIVSIDGAMQEPLVDYIINDNTITFTTPLASSSKAVVIAPNGQTSLWNVSTDARRSDWDGTYSYCGRAPYGSLESESVWLVTRILINNNGSVTVTRTPGYIIWTNHLTETYS
jgi:hypothetical protein